MQRLMLLMLVFWPISTAFAEEPTWDGSGPPPLPSGDPGQSPHPVPEPSALALLLAGSLAAGAAGYLRK